MICLDVGRGQLHWDIRRDPRVTVMEGVNIRHLNPAHLPFKPRLVTVDVSFISLRLVFPVLEEILAEGDEIIALVKPQFEAGRGKVGRKGVVRDREIHRQVLEEVILAAAEKGFNLRSLAPSPLKGADGNMEFFGWWVKGERGDVEDMSNEIEKVVNEAWERV